MDKLSDGSRLSVKRGELWTKSMTRGSSQKKWLVFLRGWEVWCENVPIAVKSSILAKELRVFFCEDVHLVRFLRSSLIQLPTIGQQFF